jgi:hypothetical protein
VSGNHAFRVIVGGLRSGGTGASRIGESLKPDDDGSSARPRACPRSRSPRRRAAIPLTQRTGADRLTDGLDSETPRLGANAAPSPDAILAPLGANQLEALREVGSEWGSGFDADTGSLPVDPSLGGQPELRQPTGWVRLVHVKPGIASPDELEATIDDGPGALDPQTVGRRIRRAVLGPPLKSTAIVQERMRKLIALPVLSADALSSVAYGPEAMLAVLVLAGGPASAGRCPSRPRSPS